MNYWERKVWLFVFGLPANFSKRNTLKLKQQTHLPTNYQLSYFSNFNKISIILLYDLSNQLKHSNFKKKIKHKQTNFSSLIYVVHFLLFLFFCCLYTELWKFTCTPIAVERQLLKTSIEQFMFLYALFSCLVSFVFVDIYQLYLSFCFFSLSLSLLFSIWMCVCTLFV